MYMQQLYSPIFSKHFIWTYFLDSDLSCTM
jgi:hypothetical protein